MASAAAELFVKISTDVKGLVKGFDETLAKLKGMGEGADGAAKPLIRLRDIIGGVTAGELLADGIKSAGQAMFETGKRALQLGAEVEQTKIAFTTMLGSTEKADAMLRDLATFAANTPFELRGLTDSTKKLLAFGFDAKAVIPIMNAVGNAVSGVGGGKATLDGVTLALGQMAAKGKVSAEEMNQLAERGIPAWKMLADGIGVSVPEAMKRAEKGAISANTAIVSLVNGMNKRFPDMMEKQSQTFSGAMSNLQDVTDATLTRIGKSLIDSLDLTGVLRNVTRAISNLTDAFYGGGLVDALNVAFGPGAKAMIIALGIAVSGTVVPSLVATAASMVPIVTGFAAAVAAAAPFIAAGLAIGAAAYVIMRQWDELQGLYLNVIAEMGKAQTWFRNLTAKAWNDIAGFIGRKLMEINGWIRATFGVDIAKQLGIGLGKAGHVFSQISMWASEKMDETSMAVRYAAEDIAANFTYAFKKSAAGAKLAIGGVTEATLGLGKAQAVAGAAAMKHHETAEQAARRHAAEVKRAEAQYMRNLKLYLAQEEATYKLREALAKVVQDKERLGLAFDEAGAKAEAYKGVLSSLEAAFGRTSLQVRGAKSAIAEYQKASEEGGAATAAAYKRLNEAGSAFTLAGQKAAALKEDFNAAAEGVKIYEDALADLVELGLKPGNKAFDDASRKLDEFRQKLSAAKNPWETLGSAIGDVTQQLSTIGNAIFDLIGLMGIKLDSGVRKVFDAMIQFGQVIGSLTLAIPLLSKAVVALNVAIAANPIGAILAVIGVAIVGAIALWNHFQEKSKEAGEAAAEAMRKADEESDKFAISLAGIPPHIQVMNEELAASAERSKESFQTIKDAAAGGLKDAILSYIAGANDYGEILRVRIREGIFNAVVDSVVNKAMMRQFDALISNIVGSFEGGITEGTRLMVDELIDKLKKTTKASAEVIKQVTEGLGMVPAEVQKMADEAVTKANAVGRSGGGGMDDRNREAMSSYHQNMLRAVQRLMDRGAQDPKSPLHNQYILALDEANKASRDLSRMATGGLVTGPVIAKMGEGGRNEAVLPLNENVYRQIGQGIAAARGGGLGGPVVVQYYGSGKWTREDAQGLGRLLVSELRAMGVRA